MNTFSLVDTRTTGEPFPIVSDINKCEAVARVADYSADSRVGITVAEWQDGAPVEQWNGAEFLAANVLDLIDDAGFLTIPAASHKLAPDGQAVEDLVIFDINTDGKGRDEDKCPWPMTGGGAVIGDQVARVANALHDLFLDGWISQDVYFFRVPDGRVWNFAEPADLEPHDDDAEDDGHLDLHTDPDLAKSKSPVPAFDIVTEARERAIRWGVPHLEQVLAIALQEAHEAGALHGIDLGVAAGFKANAVRP